MRIVAHPKSKKNKFNAVKTEIDGITFHSKKEAARYRDLKLMQYAGEITDLQLQVPFVVEINSENIFTWYADFVYNDDGEPVIEDCKGFKTDIYRLKKKAVEAYFDIEITET
jgi:hypothetical protein